MIGVTASISTASALALWARAGNPHGTVINISLDGTWRCAMATRSFGTLPRLGTPALGNSGAIMMTQMRHAVTDGPVAVHRTYVSGAGHKTHRKFLGPSRSAAIPFAPASHTQTALAACAAGRKSVWATGNSSGIAGLPVPRSVTTVVMLAENDNGASIKVVSACSARWRRAIGKRVFVVTPTTGKDFADVWASVANWREHVNIERVRQ